MTPDTSPRRIVWFSRGAASAVAWMLARRNDPDCIAVHCATNAEHPDSDRFEADWCSVMNDNVTTIQSSEYVDTWDVWERTRWLAGINGARCTGELKVAPRLAFQRPNDIHVFGYTADSEDVKRAENLRANYFDMTIETPLIDAGLTKQAVLAMVQSRGVELPLMYRLGFQNNNCIPCVKATSPNYWSLVRETHPAEFERMAKLSRELNVRLCRIKGERAFIDEIPADWPTIDPIVPACDFLCQIEDGK
jgi:3'-phosphoadenosine 5'-phosphosulfate sulfotransferase (PAPS reductase)/FAD synthetase